MNVVFHELRHKPSNGLRFFPPDRPSHLGPPGVVRLRMCDLKLSKSWN